jgi:hypothetical protein
MKISADLIKRKGRDFLIRHDGPLTRELLQKPGEFGLGRIPRQ